MYLLESPRRGDSNKYTEHMIYKRKCSKISVTDALDGSYHVSLQQQIRFYSKIFGFTAKSLVTNTVVIRRVLCTTCYMYLQSGTTEELE